MPKAATAARFPMSASLICLMLSSWRLWVFVSSLAEMNTDSFVLTAVGHQPPTNAHTAELGNALACLFFLL